MTLLRTRDEEQGIHSCCECLHTLEIGAPGSKHMGEQALAQNANACHAGSHVKTLRAGKGKAEEVLHDESIN